MAKVKGARRLEVTRDGQVFARTAVGQQAGMVGVFRESGRELTAQHGGLLPDDDGEEVVGRIGPEVNGMKVVHWDRWREGRAGYSNDPALITCSDCRGDMARLARDEDERLRQLREAREG